MRAATVAEVVAARDAWLEALEVADELRAAFVDSMRSSVAGAEATKAELGRALDYPRQRVWELINEG